MRHTHPKRQPLKVRVREKVAPYKWMLKSKFYFANGAAQARGKYRGGGQVLRVEKFTKEKAGGFGSFFTLGDKLLREFAEERRLESELQRKGGDEKAKEQLVLQSIVAKPPKSNRRYYGRQKQKTANPYR